MEDEKPAFELATICPPMVFGKVVHPLRSVDELNTSNTMVWSLVAAGMHDVPETKGFGSAAAF